MSLPIPQDDLKGLDIKRRELKYTKNFEGLEALAQQIFLSNPSGRALAIAHVCEGNALDIQKKTEATLEKYDLAIKTDPSYPEAYNEKGDALYELNRWEEALTCYNNLLSINPKHWNALCQKAYTLNNLKRYAEAIICYDEIISLNPRDADIYTFKGNALTYLHRQEEAISLFDKALELAPTDDYIYRVKADALSDLSRFPEAIICYNTSIKMAPKKILAYTGKALVLKKLTRYDEALSCCDEAIAIDPEYDYSYFTKGNILSTLDRDIEALVCYDKAINISPNSPPTYFLKGYSLVRLKRFEEAIKCYDEIILLTPQNPLGHNNKGNLLVMFGQFEEAISCYDQAIALDANDFSYYNNKWLALKNPNNITIQESLKQQAIENLINSLVPKTMLNLTGELGNIIQNRRDFKELVGTHIGKPIFGSLWDLQIKLLNHLQVALSEETNSFSVAHYQSQGAFENIIGVPKDDLCANLPIIPPKPQSESPLRMGAVATANDPIEGRVFQNFLGEHTLIGQDKLLVLQTSFSSRVDDLNQFRLYGKQIEKGEGTGICLVFNQSFFAMATEEGIPLVAESSRLISAIKKIENDPTKESSKEITGEKAKEPIERYPLYWVLYYDSKEKIFYYPPAQCAHSFDMTNDTCHSNGCPSKQVIKNMEQIKSCLAEIKECFLSITDNEEKKAALDMLIYLRHLVKDVAFKDEQEARILTLCRYEDDDVKCYPCSTSGLLKYSKDYHSILEEGHAVEKIIAGPRLKNFRQHADKWQWTIKHHNPNLNIEIVQSTLPLSNQSDRQAE